MFATFHALRDDQRRLAGRVVNGKELAAGAVLRMKPQAGGGGDQPGGARDTFLDGGEAVLNFFNSEIDELFFGKQGADDVIQEVIVEAGRLGDEDMTMAQHVLHVEKRFLAHGGDVLAGQLREQTVSRT